MKVKAVEFTDEGRKKPLKQIREHRFNKHKYMSRQFTRYQITIQNAHCQSQICRSALKIRRIKAHILSNNPQNIRALLFILVGKRVK